MIVLLLLAVVGSDSITPTNRRMNSVDQPVVIVRCVFHDPSGWRWRIRISLPSARIVAVMMAACARP